MNGYISTSVFVMSFVGRGLAMTTLSQKDSHWMFIGFTFSEVSPEVIEATGPNL
jgi:hypothetical protein